jgi:hypothetical protein
MYDRVLNRMRKLVLERRYIVTAHAYDEMAADDFAVWDVESAILTGKIVERQKDRVASEKQVSSSGGDFKWIILGSRGEVRCHRQTGCHNRL